MDFEDLNNILEDLTPGEIKEKEAIDNKYKELFEKLKTELADLQPKNYNSKEYASLANINIEDYKEWKEYEKKGSKEWHNKRTELYNLTEDYKKQVDDFIIRFQERRFTEIIKSVGIKKFFQDRIKAAEAAINKAVNENKDPETKVYTEYVLNEIIKTYKEVIEISKDVLEKTKHTKKDDLKDLSFSEILKILDNKDIELSNYYDYLPNSPATNALKMFISSMGKQDIRTSKDTKVSKKKNLTGAVEYNFKSRNSSIQLTISNYDNLVTKQDRSTRKIFNFLMQQYNLQHSKEIKFNLNDLVDRGIYKSTDTARRGLKNCMNKLTSIKVAGVIKKGNREIASTIQVLFTGMTIKNGNCIVDINEKMDIEFLAQYITLLPKWTYKLNSTAYEIIDYIFYRARQSTSDIKTRLF